MKYFGSVRFFKNMILLVVIILIAIPTGLAIYFGTDLQTAQQQLQSQLAEADALRLENETLRSTAEQTPEPDAAPAPEEPEPATQPLQAETPYADLYPDFYAPQEFCATASEPGVIYLTFDDGPSPRTTEILDILREKNVHATFFVIGVRDEAGKDLLRRIVDEGHTLAMHSFSHNYNKIYASVEDYLADMYQLFTQIKEATGVAPSLFRFPGGSINGYNSGLYQDLIAEMLRRGFVPYDWNISNEDSAASKLTPTDQLINNVLGRAQRVQRGIVLMHDSSAKTTTVAALGPTIDRLQEMGFQLKPLTPEVMPILYAYQD